jgi:hypothetical protein
MNMFLEETGPEKVNSEAWLKNKLNWREPLWKLIGRVAGFITPYDLYYATITQVRLSPGDSPVVEFICGINVLMLIGDEWWVRMGGENGRQRVSKAWICR